MQKKITSNQGTLVRTRMRNKKQQTDTMPKRTRTQSCRNQRRTVMNIFPQDWRILLTARERDILDEIERDLDRINRNELELQVKKRRQSK